MSLLVLPFTFQTLILFFYILPSKIAIYGSNDDALIASFSVNDGLEMDKDNWIFIKSLVSVPATFLQRYSSNFSVYGLILAFTIMLSVSSLFVFINYLRSNFQKIIFLVILILMSIIFSSISLINPTYTGAAVFAGTSGFAILFFLFKTDSSPALDLTILSGFLLTLSYLIRAESFYLTLGFFFVLILFEAFIVKKGKVNLTYFRVPTVFFGIFFLFNFIFDQVNYSSQEWKDYSQLNELRHSIQLRSAEYVLENHLEYLKWSEADYTMFRKFSLADPVKYSVTSMSKAIEVSDNTRGLTAIRNANLKNELIFIKYSYNNLHWLFGLILLMAAALFITLALKNFLFGVYFFLIAILSLSINYVFAVSYHLPERLIFNFLFLTSAALFIVALAEGIKTQYLNITHKLLSIFMTTLLLVSAAQVVPTDLEKRVSGNIDKIQNFKLQGSSMLAFDENAIFVGTGSRFLYQWQDPYRPYKNIDPRDKILIIGWHNFSPSWNKAVLEKEINPQLIHQAVLNNDDLYWIDDAGAKDLLTDFYSEYSNGQVLVEDLGYLGNEFFRIFKISTQP